MKMEASGRHRVVRRVAWVIRDWANPAASPSIPDGQITSDNRKRVNPAGWKYSPSAFPKFMIVCVHPILTQRGVSRSSRTLRAGCGGRRDVQRACRADEIILADGEVV